MKLLVKISKLNKFTRAKLQIRQKSIMTLRLLIMKKQSKLKMRLKMIQFLLVLMMITILVFFQVLLLLMKEARRKTKQSKMRNREFKHYWTELIFPFI